MPDDPKWELALLATVQSFYQKLLSDNLGALVPTPRTLEREYVSSETADIRQTLAEMQTWLKVLDMAVTPAMLRQALTPETDPEIAEALIRYFVRTRNFSESNRDKTDLVGTFLYRHPRVPGQWETSGYGLDGALPLSPFEIALLEILADSETPSLSEEDIQLLRGFGPLQEEADSFRDFNALIDSGIIERVRKLKADFGDSFYHPGVLATIAPYNATFGGRFDELFRGAAQEIKDFAKTLEGLGGTILSTVDGVEVTVEHAAALEPSELLKVDYAAALEKFRRVSRLKKELERRPPIRRSAMTDSFASNRGGVHVIPMRGSGAAVAAAPARQYVASAVSSQQISLEEARLARVIESIRIFVRVADVKVRKVVPMRYFNLTLSTAEVDAYGADSEDRKDSQTLVNRTLIRIVAVLARMTSEMEEMRRSHGSASLWKLRADALATLLQIGRTLNEESGRVIASAQADGLVEQTASLKASLQKMRDRADQAVNLLAHPGKQ
ncbi:MAG TPA: hypothetical protein VHR84_03960 [Terriglobales bacterium]|nr:hypothetical protein [Terriglobales bacterium]